MPDWDEIVRGRMSALALPPEVRDEVIAELAHHLDESCQRARAAGMEESDAIQVALQEVADWRVLLADISRSKTRGGLMNHRTKSLWLPGLATLLGASLLLMLIQFSGFNPRLTWFHGIGMLFYWPWLAGLPLFGASGAYLSRCGKGSLRARVVAGLSPALVMLIVMLLILPFGLAIDGFHFFRLVAFGFGLLNWVVLPGVALFLGVLPFLGSSESLEAGRETWTE